MLAAVLLGLVPTVRRSISTVGGVVSVKSAGTVTEVIIRCTMNDYRQ